MKAQIPQSSEPVLTGARLSDVWWRFLSGMFRELNTAVPLPKYTLATLPTPSDDGLLVFVTDVSSGIPAYSRGGVWRRLSDNTIVS